VRRRRLPPIDGRDAPPPRRRHQATPGAATWSSGSALPPRLDRRGRPCPCCSLRPVGCSLWPTGCSLWPDRHGRPCLSCSLRPVGCSLWPPDCSQGCAAAAWAHNHVCHTLYRRSSPSSSAARPQAPVVRAPARSLLSPPAHCPCLASLHPATLPRAAPRPSRLLPSPRRPGPPFSTHPVPSPGRRAIPPRYSRGCATPTSAVSTLVGSMSSPPPYMSFASPAALVTPGFHDSFLASPISTELAVRALLHDDQLIRGTFVSFDLVWNPILQDCVELHPQAGRHVPGPLVFPRVVTVSLAVEPVSSPSPPRASNGAPPLVLSAHTVLSSPPPPSPTTDWVIYSGASFHTTPTASSLSYSHPPHPSHPPSIVVGNGSTLPVTSVGASVLSGPFSLNDVLVSLGLTHPHLLVRRITSDNHCSMEFDPWGLTIRHLPTRAVLARCDSSRPLYSLHLTSTPPPA
jgi:small nuclear ribonucleoprotein (snRNP)-like protein